MSRKDFKIIFEDKMSVPQFVEETDCISFSIQFSKYLHSSLNLKVIIYEIITVAYFELFNN